MGCEVNGPDEARHADVGLACGKGVGLIFRRGEVVARVPEADMVDALLEQVNSFDDADNRRKRNQTWYDMKDLYVLHRN